MMHLLSLSRVFIDHSQADLSANNWKKQKHILQRGYRRYLTQTLICQETLNCYSLFVPEKGLGEKYIAPH
jgi:hypothetical protein